MNCPSCKADTHPIQEFGQSNDMSMSASMAMVSKCPRCMSLWDLNPQPKQSSQVKPVLTIVTDQSAGHSIPVSVVAEDATDVVAVIQKRLADIEGQILKLEQLRSEAAMLRKMLNAAKRLDKRKKHDTASI